MARKIFSQKGFIGLIALLITALAIVFWFAWIWKKQWFGKINTNPLRENETQNKPMPDQLNDLRMDLNEITQKKDREIQDALGESGK